MRLFGEKLSRFYTDEITQVMGQFSDKKDVRKMGIWQLGCYLLTFVLIASFKGADPLSERHPASIGGDCFHDVKLFLGKRPVLTRAWSKFKKLKGGYKLDQRKLAFYREEYARGVDTEGIQFREVNPSPEGLLAYIEAINKSLGGDHIPDSRKLSFLKRRKISKIVETMNADGKLLMNDLEDLVGDLYLTVYGPSMKANEVLFEDNIEKRVLARVIQEDMASRGLSNIFVKYKILGKKKTWMQKFVRSKVGRSLGTGVMNLGVLWGLPPIYLPGLRPIKIPEHLMADLLENGLTDDMVKKLEQEIGRELGDKLTFNLQNRARYRLFRRYYMAGISAYLTYMVITDFHETNSLLAEEAEALDELASEMTTNLENAMELEAKGYDIFEEDEEVESLLNTKPKSNRWCEAITQCLASESEELGEKIQKGSDTYKACKEFMDPENLCPSM
tara:strand:+ start:259863 stop:261200 length:1338 start_codon:yes stop_codon:yes gene_type:complete